MLPRKPVNHHSIIQAALESGRKGNNPSVSKAPVLSPAKAKKPSRDRPVPPKKTKLVQSEVTRAQAPVNEDIGSKKINTLKPLTSKRVLNPLVKKHLYEDVGDGAIYDDITNDVETEQDKNISKSPDSQQYPYVKFSLTGDKSSSSNREQELGVLSKNIDDIQKSLLNMMNQVGEIQSQQTRFEAQLDSLQAVKATISTKEDERSLSGPTVYAGMGVAAVSLCYCYCSHKAFVLIEVALNLLHEQLTN